VIIYFNEKSRYTFEREAKEIEENDTKILDSFKQMIFESGKYNDFDQMMYRKLSDQGLIKPGKYSRDFKEIQVIFSGNLTLVCKGVKSDDEKIFAIKKIPINLENSESFLKEIKMLARLKSDFVVTYESAWIEDNYMKNRGYNFYKDTDLSLGHAVFDPNKPLLMHIQMEFCSKTLAILMEQIKIELNMKDNDLLTPLCYYIASELSIELLECVNYLHKQNPPIIHRDLKPDNILITDERNGRFVKLADFGLSTIHEFSYQSHTQSLGTVKFIAPEVLEGRNYDTKADIYSLGAVMQNIFNIDINE
jgi:serine/threonine protein kinase